MIDFYKADTPNAHKVTIMLEETGLAYKVHPVDLKANEQKQPQFLEMNPNGRIPVIVDHEGPNGKQTVFESGAILYYLAEKTGKFFGHSLAEKTHVMQWLMFQMSAVGPMFGNYGYGNRMNPKNPGYIERFDKESSRVVSVLNRQLSTTSFLAGNSYSIADMATYPWVAPFLKSRPEWFELNPSVRRWAGEISERAAVAKVMG